MIRPAICLSLFAPLFAQTANVNPHLPPVKSIAPPLSFTTVLQAPPETKVDLAALRGKVVVLEFWATWCAPCIGEIPVLNALQASVDASKVRIISVDDEDPAVVKNFLKKKSISGWIGIDTTGRLFERYGVTARPVTVVIGPDGRIVSNNVKPEDLSAKALMEIADGKQVKPKTQATETIKRQLAADTAKAWNEKSGAADAVEPLSGISVTPSESGSDNDMHIMSRKQGQMDITNGTVAELLSAALSLPKQRILASESVPATRYNLHINVEGADAKQLASAVELAVASAAHVRIEHMASIRDVYVLTSSSHAHMVSTPYPGGAYYSHHQQLLQCLNATTQEMASAFESALEMPVVDETGVDGKFMQIEKLSPRDFGAANAAAAEFGFTLKPAKRSINTLQVSPVTR